MVTPEPMNRPVPITPPSEHEDVPALQGPCELDTFSFTAFHYCYLQ
jgi:hypothetical protein